MKKLFIVNVVAEIINEYGEVVTKVCQTPVTVKAITPQAASKAAVLWFGDNSTVYRISEKNEEPTSYACDEGCHFSILLPLTRIRYTSIKVLSVSQQESDLLAALTTGYVNQVIVTAE